MAALVLVGLPLAYAGAFVVPVVLVLALALTAGLIWLADVRRGGVSAAPSRGWWGGAYALAAVSALVNGRLASEHSIADRDPGVYAMTARWLVRHHDLAMPPPSGPFAGQLSAGLTPASDGSLQFQFVHGLPVLQAVGDWVLGENGLYRLPPLLAALALLVFFGLALELLRPPWALLATVVLAVSLPFVYVAREGLTEALMLTMLGGGAWMLLSALRVASTRRAALAGVLFGASAGVRIDFPVYGLALALVVLWVGTLPGAREPGSAWRGGARAALLAGLVPGVALGLLDVIGRSRAYFDTERSGLIELAVATVAVVAAATVVPRSRAWPRVRAAWARHRRRVAVAAVGLLVLAAGLAVALPALVTRHGGDFMVRHATTFIPLQQRDGVDPVDATRTFYEYAGHWLAWAAGWPAFVLAIAGAALLLWRVVLGEARAAQGVVLAFAVVPLALIVVHPSIYPDQPWATRRMVPFALPGALLLATVAVSWAAGRLGTRGRRVAVAAAAVGAVVLVVPAAVTTARVGRFQDYAGMQRPIDAVCAAVPGDAALLVLNDSNLPVVLPGVLTTWCGVPASGTPSGSAVPALASAWQAQGRQLWAVAGSDATLVRAGFTPVAQGSTLMRHALRPRLLGAPDATYPKTYQLVVGRRTG